MAQKKKKLKKVTKPYLTGSVVDGHSVKAALSNLGMMVAMMILFLLLGSALSFDQAWLNYLLNGALLLVAYSIFYFSGISSGSSAVNQGEICYNRQESGRPCSAKEVSLAYHPLKGFCNGALGAVPLVICCLILALNATKQSYGIGALPSWVSNATEVREELAAPLTFYSVTVPFTIVDGVRVLARMALMPLVSMLGATNYDLMLVLDRLSPVLVLIPGICYGFGYTRGVSVRTQVHSQIAANKRKKKRTTLGKDGMLKTGAQKKAKKPSTRNRNTPEQLN